PLPPRQRNPRISTALEATIGKAMEVERARRFQTAAEFDAALGDEAPTSAPGPAEPAPAERPGWALASVALHGGSATERGARAVWTERARRAAATVAGLAIAIGTLVALGGSAWLGKGRLRQHQPAGAAAERARRPTVEPRPELVAAGPELVELRLRVE